MKCKKAFQNEEHLIYHINNEDQDIKKPDQPKRFHFSEVNSCPQCDDLFKTKAQLENHLDTEHMDTKINNTIEGPAPEVILKTTQFHCALSNFSNTTECTFQCDSKEE